MLILEKYSKIILGNIHYNNMPNKNYIKYFENMPIKLNASI